MSSSTSTGAGPSFFRDQSTHPVHFIFRRSKLDRRGFDLVFRRLPKGLPEQRLQGGEHVFRRFCQCGPVADQAIGPAWIEGRKAGGKVGLDRGNHPAADRGQCFQFGGGLGIARCSQIVRPAAARQARRFRERFARIAKARDERRECGGSDGLAARQPQPRTPFFTLERPASAHRAPI